MFFPLPDPARAEDFSLLTFNPSLPGSGTPAAALQEAPRPGIPDAVSLPRPLSWAVCGQVPGQRCQMTLWNHSLLHCPFSFLRLSLQNFQVFDL